MKKEIHEFIGSIIPWPWPKDRVRPDHNWQAVVYELSEASSYYIYLKKHYCKECGDLLERKERVTIEKNRGSGEIGTGPSKVVRYYFYCERCQKEYSLKEMQLLGM